MCVLSSFARSTTNRIIGDFVLCRCAAKSGANHYPVFVACSLCVSHIDDVVAQLHLNNLHGVMAVHAALCGSAVARLQKTWALVAPVSLVAFGRCDRLMSPQLNYKVSNNTVYV